jgi:hypothetical protein
MFGINPSSLSSSHQSLISGMELVIIPSDYHIDQESDGVTVENRNSAIAPRNKIQ